MTLSRVCFVFFFSCLLIVGVYDDRALLARGLGGRVCGLDVGEVLLLHGEDRVEVCKRVKSNCWPIVQNK